jgi:hypothetical protein
MLRVPASPVPPMRLGKSLDSSVAGNSGGLAQRTKGGKSMLEAFAAAPLPVLRRMVNAPAPEIIPRRKRRAPAAICTTAFPRGTCPPGAAGTMYFRCYRVFPLLQSPDACPAPRAGQPAGMHPSPPSPAPFCPTRPVHEPDSSARCRRLAIDQRASGRHGGARLPDRRDCTEAYTRLPDFRAKECPRTAGRSPRLLVDRQPRPPWSGRRKCGGCLCGGRSCARRLGSNRPLCRHVRNYGIPGTAAGPPALFRTAGVPPAFCAKKASVPRAVSKSGRDARGPRIRGPRISRGRDARAPGQPVEMRSF